MNCNEKKNCDKKNSDEKIIYDEKTVTRKNVTEEFVMKNLLWWQKDCRE